MRVLCCSVLGLACLALLCDAKGSVDTSDDDHSYSPRLTTAAEPWSPRAPHAATAGTTISQVLDTATTKKTAKGSSHREVRRGYTRENGVKQQVQTLPSTAKPPLIKSKFLSAMLKHVFNLENDVRALRSETAQGLKRIEEAVSAVNAKMGEEPWPKALAKMTRQTFTQYWNINNFRGHISRAVANTTTIKSDKFIIGGYTAKLRASLENVAGEMSLGIYFHLCPGPDDSLLRWPFISPFVLSLVHPKFPRKNVLHVAIPQSFAEGDSAFYKRPKGTCGAGYGIRQFRTLKATERDGFVFDNAITVSVTLYRLAGTRTVY
ncbi:uncharacterized protein LOC135400012 isoform X2 [Ornithodoros turicata]|uniref:uncharacterized protein LOC135400012 isoform X2 n=1 Tax=Ornithodoros turicata TaxID=34597 RepID=UPI00313972CA